MRFVIFGAVGLVMEVFWTGLGSLIAKDRRATSKTSIWMFFIYGLAGFMMPLALVLSPVFWLWRAIIYAVCIFVVEYAFGRALKAMDACPWDYSGVQVNVHGVIRLDYAPLWMAVGLIMEYIHFNFFLIQP